MAKLLAALATNSQVILEAPPGAGKTTGVPLALLNEQKEQTDHWLGQQRIIMLEPRRIAARNAATYMAQQIGEAVGQTIGYRMRMDTKVSAATRLEVVTEGVLTRMIQDDPELPGVGLIIFDEFHERSLQADLGLALCLEIQQALREDLKLLVMSATLDTGELQTYLEQFSPAPIVSSEGKSFPVETRYLPARHNEYDWQHWLRGINQTLNEEQGSILMFLPGEGEIRRVADRLNEQNRSDVEICPLYGKQTIQQQQKAIQPSANGQRKLVLATNIAESSLTIEGICIVIDAGLQRSARFNPNSGMQGLHTHRISRASADQRRGRAGRLQPGICIRLWPESEPLVAQTDAEILHADLAPLRLELARWGSHDLPWLTAPNTGSMAQATDLLVQLEALHEDGSLTNTGQAMASLPLHPRLAHMLVKTQNTSEGKLACDIAALLSDRDPLKISDPDINLRLQAMAKQHPSYKNLNQQSKELQRRLKIKAGAYSTDSAGELLAMAFVDRIAQLNNKAQQSYRLSNGKGAQLKDQGHLSDSPFLVIADMQGDQRQGNIYLAASLDIQRVQDQQPELFEQQEYLGWDDNKGQVIGEERLLLGKLVINKKPLKQLGTQQKTQGLLEHLKNKGLPFTPDDKRLLARLKLFQTSNKDITDFSIESLQQQVHQWLGPFVEGITSLTALKKINLTDALLSRLSWDQQQQLAKVVPTHIKVPSGSNVAIDYSQHPPVLAVRIQEIFGAPETPTILNGKQPLMMHLLSPARKPLQVTQDLANFWKNTYTEVRKEMKGRYPRHYWPEDPYVAEATSKTKKYMDRVAKKKS